MTDALLYPQILGNSGVYKSIVEVQQEQLPITEVIAIDPQNIVTPCESDMLNSTIQTAQKDLSAINEQLIHLTLKQYDRS